MVANELWDGCKISQHYDLLTNQVRFKWYMNLQGQKMDLQRYTGNFLGQPSGRCKNKIPVEREFGNSGLTVSADNCTAAATASPRYTQRWPTGRWKVSLVNQPHGGPFAFERFESDRRSESFQLLDCPSSCLYDRRAAPSCSVQLASPFGVATVNWTVSVCLN